MASTREKASSATTSASTVAGIVASEIPKPGLEDLTAMARELRRDIVEMIFKAGSGHPGGSLSEIDILTALYCRVLRYNPHDPAWPERDRFILSKGHACPGLYAVLARSGYFPREELWTFRQIDSRLQGHAHPMTPGVEMNSGSLGQGALLLHRGRASSPYRQEELPSLRSPGRWGVRRGAGMGSCDGGGPLQIGQLDRFR